MAELPGEQAFDGGTTPGVVRKGDVVCRPAHDRSRYVQSVLRQLRADGFTQAPRPLGFDDQGREVVSYVHGRVHDAADLTERQLASVAAVIRRFHDTTAGTPLADGGEVVLHGDLGPHNTVFAGDEAVGLIDWDADVGPGARIRDVGHAVWCFADIGEHGGPLSVQARRARVFCDAYGWTGHAELLAEITERFHRARTDHLMAGREEAVVIFDEYIAWMQRSTPSLLSLM